MAMKFERLTDDARLWAVVYDGEEQNVFDKVFDSWTDVVWLRTFFKNNMEDLASYFHITDLDVAIFDTVDDACTLECLMLDITPEANLDLLFRPLSNYSPYNELLSKEKAKGAFRKHSSWLRLYAIRLQSGRYIITGGAIKLTATMEEREHTLNELKNLNLVRNYLISLGIADYDGFASYESDQQ